MSVVLFCNGGDGIYSGIQTDGIQGQIEALQIIEPSGPDISFGVFYNVADILVRTNVVRIEQVREKYSTESVLYLFCILPKYILLPK